MQTREGSEWHLDQQTKFILDEIDVGVHVFGRINENVDILFDDHAEHLPAAFGEPR